MDKNEEEGVRLPNWYLLLEKGASKLFMGCFSAELMLIFGAKYVISGDVIKIMHGIIVPFGILCLILSGSKSIEQLNNILDTIKKIKENGR